MAMTSLSLDNQLVHIPIIPPHQSHPRNPIHQSNKLYRGTANSIGRSPHPLQEKPPFKPPKQGYICR